MTRRHLRSMATVLCAVCMTLNPFVDAWGATQPNPAESYPTTTPIKHLVVIFGENVSFDHYFATYPNATNPATEPGFTPLANTPRANNLLSGGLLTENPNSVQPFRLDRTQAVTCDQNHSYTPEQQAFDMGAMDMFVQFTGTGGSTCDFGHGAGLVMGYYDGNTVTAMWNYAQHYALSDNSYNSQFGPSTPGALNVISGQTNGIIASINGPSSNTVADGQGGLTLIGDADPLGDVCSNPTGFQPELGGKNIGDLLNAAGLSWGWFHGGFDLTVTNPNGTTGCHRSTVSPVTGLTEGDYVQHHQPFQYYASTRNTAHTRPTSIAMIGQQGDAANHQYDTHDFFDALAAGNLPAVSYLKAQSFQDAHPGNSNPLDEQNFVVTVINALQSSAFWSTTAVI